MKASPSAVDCINSFDFFIQKNIIEALTFNKILIFHRKNIFSFKYHDFLCNSWQANYYYQQLSVSK